MILQNFKLKLRVRFIQLLFRQFWHINTRKLQHKYLWENFNRPIFHLKFFILEYFKNLVDILLVDICCLNQRGKTMNIYLCFIILNHIIFFVFFDRLSRMQQTLCIYLKYPFIKILDPVLNRLIIVFPRKLHFVIQYQGVILIAITDLF